MLIINLFFGIYRRFFVIRMTILRPVHEQWTWTVSTFSSDKKDNVGTLHSTPIIHQTNMACLIKLFHKKKKKLHNLLNWHAHMYTNELFRTFFPYMMKVIYFVVFNYYFTCLLKIDRYESFRLSKFFNVKISPKSNTNFFSFGYGNSHQNLMKYKFMLWRYLPFTF